MPKIENARIRLRSRGRIAKITCSLGFTLEGLRSITCQSGRWEDETPLCISNPRT